MEGRHIVAAGTAADRALFSSAFLGTGLGSVRRPYAGLHHSSALNRRPERKGNAVHDGSDGTGTSPTDHLLNGTIPLAVRDFGGAGPTVVLLHGLGGNLVHWGAFAPLLTDGYRVLAADLRGHGRSGDGPWTWEAVLDDVETVVDHFEVESPVVIGHSLGGAVATRWVLRHPDCPAAVNLDMLRTPETALENYVGMDPERAHQARARLRDFFTGQTTAMAAPLPAEQVEAMRAQHRGMAGELGAEAFDRNLDLREDGAWLRPNAELLAQVRQELLADEMFALFERVRSPLLVCAAGVELPVMTGDGPSSGEDAAGTAELMTELMAAYRRGIDRDITAVSAVNPHVTFTKVEASHGMVLERPAELADLIRGFLDTPRT